MPIEFRSTRGGMKESAVPKYVLSSFYELDPDLLKARRIAAIRHRDEMAAFKAECGKRGDRDGARFFKEEEADSRMEYRAVCLLLPWYTQDVGGDCPLRDLYEVGPELFPYLLRVEYECERR